MLESGKDEDKCYVTITLKERRMRFFVETLNQVFDVQHKIKGGEIKGVVQVIIGNSLHIKKFIWFLLREDISFNRVAAGGGIAIFYVDTKIKFFVEAK